MFEPPVSYLTTVQPWASHFTCEFTPLLSHSDDKLAFITNLRQGLEKSIESTYYGAWHIAVA